MVKYVHVWWNVAVAKKNKKRQWLGGSGCGWSGAVAVDGVVVWKRGFRMSLK
jgi:hypothetical protein